ncbi:MAG: PEP-CTERM sorting domain-containing protein [Aquabacterium sp.]
MKQHGSIKWACAAALLAAATAHAGITQAPTLPAQVSLKWSDLDLDDEGRPLITLVASGSASLQDGSWVASVDSLAPGLIHLGDDAGLTFKPAGPQPKALALWKDITIDYVTQTVTGDAYVNGVKVSNDQLMFFTAGPDFGADVLPQGQSLLGIGSNMCKLTLATCSVADVWLPQVVGSVSVTAVPEPSSGLAMASGLSLLGLALRAREKSVNTHPIRRTA